MALPWSAAPFLERHGYRVIERATADSAAQASEEFRSLCAASSICMVKALAGKRSR